MYAHRSSFGHAVFFHCHVPLLMHTPPFFVCASLWDPTIVYTLNQPTGDCFLRTRWIWVYLPCNNFSDWVVANQRPPTKTFLNKPLRVVVSSYYQLLDFLKSRINVVIVWMGKLWKTLIESRFHGQPMIPQLGKHEDFSSGPPRRYWRLMIEIYEKYIYIYIYRYIYIYSKITIWFHLHRYVCIYTCHSMNCFQVGARWYILKVDWWMYLLCCHGQKGCPQQWDSAGLLGQAA